jgi:hypothetical protein
MDVEELSIFKPEHCREPYEKYRRPNECGPRDKVENKPDDMKDRVIEECKKWVEHSHSISQQCGIRENRTGKTKKTA